MGKAFGCDIGFVTDVMKTEITNLDTNSEDVKSKSTSYQDVINGLSSVWSGDSGEAFKLVKNCMNYLLDNVCDVAAKQRDNTRYTYQDFSAYIEDIGDTSADE